MSFKVMATGQAKKSAPQRRDSAFRTFSAMHAHWQLGENSGTAAESAVQPGTGSLGVRPLALTRAGPPRDGIQRAPSAELPSGRCKTYRG
jgi:hypothetical protein